MNAYANNFLSCTIYLIIIHITDAIDINISVINNKNYSLRK